MTIDALGPVQTPMADLLDGRLNAEDRTLLTAIFKEKAVAGQSNENPSPIKKAIPGPLTTAKKVYIQAQEFINSFLTTVRSTNGLVEVVHNVSLTTSRNLAATKVVAFGAIPADLIDSYDSVQAAISATNGLDRTIHISAALANLLNLVGDTWTGMMGISILADLPSKVVTVFETAGPIAWGAQAIGLIFYASKFHKVEKLDSSIRQTKRDHGLSHYGRLQFFKLLLQDEKGVRFTKDQVLDTLNLSGNIPLIESKSNVRKNLQVIAQNYLLTGDTEITNDLGKLVNKQMRMTRVLLVVKSVAALTGLFSSIFFYLPAFNKFQHLAWAQLIICSSLTMSFMVFSKINSRMWIKELEKLAEDSMQKLDQEKPNKDLVAQYYNFLKDYPRSSIIKAMYGIRDQLQEAPHSRVA